MKHQLPGTVPTANMTIEDLMKTTMRMNELLAKENELLSRMKVVELTPLRAEKEKLTQQLETYKKLLATDAGFVARASADAKEALLNLTDDLSYALEENMHRMTVARAANQRVMETITKALSDQQGMHTYGRKGKATGIGGPPISLNLNQKA